MYYLQSRYYDPELGRFLNADSYASTGQGILGCNMFAYCNNSPVNCVDPTGYWPSIGESVNPNAMAFMSGTTPYWGPCPWDEDGHLKETIFTNFEMWQSEMEKEGYSHLVNGTKDVTLGVRNIKKGATLLFVPMPTLIDDIAGIGQATYGVLQFTGGLTKIAIALWRKGSD